MLSLIYNFSNKISFNQPVLNECLLKFLVSSHHSCQRSISLNGELIYIPWLLCPPPVPALPCPWVFPSAVASDWCQSAVGFLRCSSYISCWHHQPRLPCCTLVDAMTQNHMGWNVLVPTSFWSSKLPDSFCVCPLWLVLAGPFHYTVVSMVYGQPPL